MRAFLATLVLLAVAVSAGAPKFSFCNGAGANLQNGQITTDTANWKQGTTVHFTVTGTLASEFPGGHADTQAFFFGSEVENKRDDLCTYDGTPFTCPTAAGAVSWTFPFEIPALPFSGKLTSHTDFPQSNGQQLMCIDMEVGL